MKKFTILALGAMTVLAMSLVSVPAVQADPIQLVNDAIVELTDAPALGKRTTVDLNKRWGADVGVMKSATAKLQQALSEVGGNANARAQLQLAVEYGMAQEHKEARLSAQGALYYLCQGASGPGCDTVPKYGSYTAP
jgi:hypothetical protein